MGAPDLREEKPHYHCSAGCEKSVGETVNGIIVCARCGADWVECNPEICYLKENNETINSR